MSRTIDWASLGGEWDDPHGVDACARCGTKPGIRPHTHVDATSELLCAPCLNASRHEQPPALYADPFGVAAYRRDMAAADEWESKHGRGCDDVEAREREAKDERDYYNS